MEILRRHSDLGNTGPLEFQRNRSEHCRKSILCGKVRRNMQADFVMKFVATGSSRQYGSDHTAVPNAGRSSRTDVPAGNCRMLESFGREFYHQSMNTTSPIHVSTAAHILDGTIGQIQFARDYVRQLLEATPHELWFEMPSGVPTNVAWQVGHLAVSQYGLLMFRVRGRMPEDLELIPGAFRKAYTRQSTPSSDATVQMSPAELVDRLSIVYERAMNELATVDPAVLLEPVDMPYAAYPTKLGAIMFCPMHEMLHAGQIGLIRRSLGLDPVR